MPIRNREALLSHGNVAGRRVVLEMMDAGDRRGRSVRKHAEAASPRRGPADRRAAGAGGIRSRCPGVRPECDEAHLRRRRRQSGAAHGEGLRGCARGPDFRGAHLHQERRDCRTVARGRHAGRTPPAGRGQRTGAARILQILGRAGEGDLVFWLRSGGGTALLALPAPGLTLADLLQVYRVLYFGAGASMPEANSVRNLVSVLNMKHQKYVRGAVPSFEFLADEVPTGPRGHAPRAGRRGRATPISEPSPCSTSTGSGTRSRNQSAIFWSVLIRLTCRPRRPILPSGRISSIGSSIHT